MFAYVAHVCPSYIINLEILKSCQPTLENGLIHPFSENTGYIYIYIYIYIYTHTRIYTYLSLLKRCPISETR